MSLLENGCSSFTSSNARVSNICEVMRSINSFENAARAEEALFYPHLKKSDVASLLMREFPERAFCLLNVAQLGARVALMKNAFIPRCQGRNIAYAVKANPSPYVLNILAEAGIDHFDCASIEEIKLISRLFPKAQKLYNHPIKHLRDIKEAFSYGVTLFTAQSKSEIDKILKAAQGQESPEVVIRMATQSSGARIPLSEKFGASFDSVLQMLLYMKGKPIKYGLSIHVGSQNPDTESHRKEILRLFALARQAGGVDSINVGGGMPVNYDNRNQHCLRRYLEHLSPSMMQNLEGVFRGSSPRFYIEPGRAMVAESISLLVPVMAKEVRSSVPCIYIDDGIFTSFSDALIHQWHYNFRVVAGDSRPVSAKELPMTIYGRTCDSGDKICEVNLPENVREGDYLFVSAAGAYLDSQSTRFNGFKPPQYVLYNAEA